jgi:hypothetical protein
MTDYIELKMLAESLTAHAEDSFYLPCTVAFERAATPSAVLALIAESESLRQDAARYRWLNRQRRSVWRELGAAPMNMTGELIDAAMGKESHELPGTLSEWAAADFNVKQMSREG